MRLLHSEALAESSAVILRPPQPVLCHSPALGVLDHGLDPVVGKCLVIRDFQ